MDLAFFICKKYINSVYKRKNTDVRQMERGIKITLILKKVKINIYRSCLYDVNY